MEKLLWVFSLLGLWALANGATPSATAPSPSVDCSSVLLSMADCLSFVMNGSTVSKPEGSCCSGFKMVLKQSPKCLCEAFKNNNNLGIALNMTKATALPSACGVSTPPLSNCAKINGAPLGAPGPSPSSISPSAAPGSSSIPSTGGSAAATAPSPSQSDAAAISTSVAVLALSLAIIICSYF